MRGRHFFWLIWLLLLLEIFYRNASRKAVQTNWNPPIGKNNMVKKTQTQNKITTKRGKIIIFKTESIRKLSNSNFQWAKTLYHSILNNIAFFFTFFKGYRCNQLSVITHKENFLLEPEKIKVKYQKTTCTDEIFRILPMYSEFFVKFDIYFLGLPGEIVFGLLQINGGLLSMLRSDRLSYY